MKNPWDWKNQPSIFANDKNFNGGNEKKKTSVSENTSSDNTYTDATNKKNFNLLTNHSKKK